jgi:nucleobase:cation symporter-1, NCS1 family
LTRSCAEPGSPAASLTWLFLNGLIPPLQGAAARALNGLDLSWLAGMLSAGLLYYALYRLGFVTRGGTSRQETAGPSRAGGTGA